jgi:NADH-quinone oxidoreductase subunit M
VVAVILVLGFYPSPLLRVINPASVHSIAQVGFSDPLSSIEKAGK